MPATRTCPRCQTTNDVARSTCESCGGVMLGVGVSLATTGYAPLAEPAPEPDLAATIHERLAQAKNLSPEKREQIEQALLRRAAKMEATIGGTAAPAARSRSLGCVFIVAFAVLFASSGALLFFRDEMTRSQRDTQAAIALAAATARQKPTPAPDPVAEAVAPDEVQPDALDPPLFVRQPSDQTLTREQLRPLRPCFRGHGTPTQRPMSFGIEMADNAVNVFAMTDVQVPEKVTECLQRHAPVLHLSPGVYFVDWPLDEAWP